MPTRLMIGVLLISAGLAVPAAAQDEVAPDGTTRTLAKPQPEANDGIVTTAPGGAGATRTQPGQSPNLRQLGEGQPGTGQPGGQPAGRPGMGQPGQPGMVQPGAGRSNGAFPGGFGRQPGMGANAVGQQPRPGPGDVVLPVLSEALDLRALVEYVADTLSIGIAASEELTGSVVINAPMTVPREELLELLDSLLEHQGFTIVPDRLPGWYRVVRIEGVGPEFRGPMATTRIIPTPTLRPSSLADLINTHMGGMAAPGMAARQPRLAFLDDLGVIIVTDTPRRIQMLEELVARVLDRSAEQQFIRFDLSHIAANVARQRVLDLIGQQAGAVPGMPPGVQPGVPGVAAGSLGHLGDRLSIDQQGNSLILRGFPDEAARVEVLLRVIDVPNQLEPRQYFAGAGAMQIAQMAERFGYGRIESMDAPASSQQPTQMFAIQAQAGRPVTFQQQQQQSQVQGAGGGPVLVVDQVRGTIIYYGTPTQHRSLESLISIFDAEQELVDIRAYKIKNQQAEDIADLLNGLVFQQSPTGSSAFLPQTGGGAGQLRQQFGTGTQQRGATQQRGTTQQGIQRTPSTGRRMDSAAEELAQPAGTTTAQQLQQQRIAQQRAAAGLAPQPGQPTAPGATFAGEGAGALGGDNVFILADRANNQVLVKAPGRQQEEFARLIEQLDQRRPQVYLEVQIVSVSATDDFRLAFETQLINSDKYTGAVNTNFGLGTVPAAGNNILQRKNVPLSLTGFTAALIKSDQVPIIINALRREADTRILSSPQLLVDDNETAEILSYELQPTVTRSIGVSGAETEGFGGFEQAGTSLLVTPSISDGGYLRLQYAVELSNFIGTGSGVIPPAKQTRNISSDSVTIPGDTTIIVGGIQVDSENRTVLKVPLLGDIPLIGHLFRDTNKGDSTTRLYVFITPKIMRDPHFRDLILLTRGPQAEAGLSVDMPMLQPVMIEMIDFSTQRGGPAAQPNSTLQRDPWGPGDATEN
jgi:general secretion pathway protein D